LSDWNDGAYAAEQIRQEEDERILQEMEMYINKELRQQETNNMFRIYASVNAADTSRDPDDIHITELGTRSGLSSAQSVARKYIKETFYHKNTKLNKSSPGNYRATDLCSYGATVIIEPLTMDICSDEVVIHAGIPGSDNLSELLQP